MPKKIHKILAINPGTRYIGTAVFEGPELLDWAVKVAQGKFCKEKRQRILQVLRDFIDRNEPDILAIKKLHRSRSSANLNTLVGRIKQTAKRKGLKIYQYPIKDVEGFFIPEGKKNKNKLAQIMTWKYPELVHEFNKEEQNKNHYHIRMFEAVALGAMCCHKLENN